MTLTITEISKENHASVVVKIVNHASRYYALTVTPHAANLGPITHHADNLGPITGYGKPLLP